MANNCWYCRKGGIVDLYFAGRTGVCPICRSGVNVQFDVSRFIALDNITTEVDNWAKSSTGSSEPNEPLTMAQLKALPEGTMVYCYILVGDKLEPDPCVRRIKNGVIFKRSVGHGFHHASEIAIDGKKNGASGHNRRVYLKEVDLNGGNSGNSGSQREYKVGDRVVSEAGNIRGYNDQVGVIVEIDLTYDYPYAIDFGKHTIWCKVKCLANDDKPLTLEELKQMDGQRVWCSRFKNGVEHFKGEYCDWYIVDAKNEKITQVGDKGFDLFHSNGMDFGFHAYRTDQSHRANEEEIPF